MKRGTFTSQEEKYANSSRRIYRIQNLNQKQEWAFAFFYHISVVVGVALTAAGSAKLQHHEQPMEKNQKLVKAGMSILTVTWVILVGWAGLSFAAPKAKSTDIVRAGNVVCFVAPSLPGVVRITAN